MSKGLFDYYVEDHEDPDDWLPSYEELLGPIEAKIMCQAAQIVHDVGLDKNLSMIIEDSRGNNYCVVESNVGDDSNVTTNSLLYGILTICAAPHISFIKLSDKDVGISRVIANYAEGWMFTPPTAGSSFQAVNRYNKGRGLAFVLDPVKLKYLSAVRKQSSEEMDLESKLIHLAEIAAWTDRSWFTYDYHQMSLILANCVFDFSDARSFPYLYKTEGGSGGMPPYGSSATAYSGLHYYTRGRSRRAIVGVMQESLAISHLRMKPKDSYFLRASHLANAGDREWAHYESAYRTALANGRMSRAEVRDMLHHLQGGEIAEDIAELGVEVTPERFTVGSAIAHLRNKGHLMTEIDVRLFLQKMEKEKSVFGTKPIGELLQEQELQAKIFKGQSWKVLTQIYEAEKRVKQEVDTRLGHMDTSHEFFSEVANAYYRLRGDHNAEFTSFFYTDTIRVYKTKDIQNRFGRKDFPLQRDFLQSELVPKFRPEPVESRHELETREEINSWLDSGDLNDLLDAPLPTGIGTDDSRIMHDIVNFPVNKTVTGTVVVIISDDSGLIRTAAALLSKRDWGNSTTAVVSQLRRPDYTAICLQGVREAYEMRVSGLRKPARIHAVGYYNYILKQMWYLPETTVRGVRELIPGNWRKQVDCRLYYDVPNLERGLERTVYHSNTNTVTVLGGGSLERITIESLPFNQSWAELPISTISRWDDFSSSRRRKIHAKDVRIRAQAFVARPESVISTTRIDMWLDSAIQRASTPVVQVSS